MTLLEAAQAVVRLKRVGAEHHGACPACGDGEDRFWVNESGGLDGTGRYACRQCGASGNAVDFLKGFHGMSEARARVELGLDLPEDWARRPWALGLETARYTYRDADGTPLLDVVRWECPLDHPLAGTSDGKTFRPTTPGGVTFKRPKVPRVLYRLPEVLEAVRQGETVYVCEGEKDADNLARLGVCATSGEGGAGRWYPTYTEALRGARVVILPDNDEPGGEHASTVASALYGVAAEVLPVFLPGLPPKGDVSDWLAAGGTLEKLRAEEAGAARAQAELSRPASPTGSEMLSARIPILNGQKESAPPVQPAERGRARRVVVAPPDLLACFRSGVDLAASPAPPTEWIAGRLFPRGGLVQLTGATKGGGKTTLLCHALGAIVRGLDFLGEPTMQTGAVYLTEQARSTFEPEYLTPAGLLIPGAAERIRVLYGYEASGYGWEAVVAAAVETCRRAGAGLLAVDTFGYWSGIEDENDSARMQRALRPLQDAAASGLCVVAVHHDRKGGGETWEAGRGSSAFAGAVDVIVNVRRPQGGQSDTVRELRCEGRYGELFDSLMIELTPEGYVSHGTARSVAYATAERAVLSVLPTSEGDALSIRELEDALKDHGVSRSTLQRVLDALTPPGRVRCIGEGKKGDPYRYLIPLEEQIGLPQASGDGWASPAVGDRC